MNQEFSKNRILRSGAQTEKNSLVESSEMGNKNLTISRANNVKSTLAGKEINSSININRGSKMKTNQSMQINEPKQFSSRVSSNNHSNNPQIYSSLKKYEAINDANKGMNTTLHKKKNTQYSIKSNKFSTSSNKSTIEYDDQKLSHRKSDKVATSSIGNNKFKSPSNKTTREKPTPTVIYETKNTPNHSQNIRGLNFPEKEGDKGFRKPMPGTVQQLNVKININQLNQLQTNNNTINNIYESHTPKMNKKLKVEKEVIFEEKENYSSPDSNNGKIVNIPFKKSAEKNESSNSESDTNIDVINENRHNTPAFNHVHKRSSSSGNMGNVEFNKKKHTHENKHEPNCDDKFSFRGSNNDSMIDEENDDADFNYNQAMNYIVPRMGSLEKNKKFEPMPNTHRTNEFGKICVLSNIFLKKGGKIQKFKQRIEEKEDQDLEYYPQASK
jgi:hypothetical protein